MRLPNLEAEIKRNGEVGEDIIGTVWKVDGEHQFKITKPIRLIELFAGIGSQAKALRNLGANFEHYRICEFDKYAVQSYNEIHGTSFATSDITKISAEDLGITDTDKYEYIMTYSFPCTDLSKAGQQKGMAKGSGTRSGLLWEVERLLDECVELPQVLLMENVTEVHGEKNKEHFYNWCRKLESLGYHNYWQDLNAKNYGIPQNRNRCFMVSILGDYYYEFPKGKKLELRLEDMLETEVEEKYYLSETGVKFFEDRKDKMNVRKNGDAKTTILEPPHGYSNGQEYDTDIFPTLTTGTSQHWKTVLKEPQLIQLAQLQDSKYNSKSFEYRKPTIDMARTLKSEKNDSEIVSNYRIRKLTPKECWRLMGFNDSDFNNAQKVNSNAQLYKQAGNAIVVDVLMAIFKEIL